MLTALELFGGLIIASLTLRDVFYTVVVPGESHGPLRVVRRLTFLHLVVYRHLKADRDGLATSFAPLVLVFSFATWMMLLVLGFSLMTYSFRTWFNPVLESFSQAVYVAGSGLATIGLSETDAMGPARWVALAGGFCGLAVMTLAVTYLLEVQASIAQRDSGILRLDTLAGNPPCALSVLERYAQLDCRGDIPQLLRDGRTWCAAVLQSHAAHPSLIYFRSLSIGAGWPAALGALMDTAVIAEVLLDGSEARATAILLREEGTRMAKTLSGLVGLQPQARPTLREDVDRIVARLSALNYDLRSERDYQRLISLRNDYAPYISALARHLHGVEAPLVPRPSGLAAEPQALVALER